MAALGLTVQLFVNGAWTTYPGYSEEGWSTRIGPDVQSGLQPNQLSVTLNNDDLSMDPSNVASSLYGLIGRNTPARIQIDGGDIVRAEASSWKPQRSQEHVPSTGVGLSSTRLTAEGLLRRLAKWDDPIQSPMTRQIQSYPSLIGYWPLEDPSSALQFTSRVNKVGPGTFSGSVTLQGDAGPGGSDQTVTIGADGHIGGTFAGSGGNGFQVCWSTKLDAAPTSGTFETIMSFTDNLSQVWRWKVNNASMLVEVTAEDGVTLVTSLSAGYGATPLTQYIRYRLRVTISGSTVTFEPAWYAQDAGVIFGYTGTFSASSTGRPRTWAADGNPWTDGAAYGHVFAVTNTSLDLTSADAANCFNGYLNERAGARWARIMDEVGLAHYTSGDATKSARMGRQKPGKIVDLLEEIMVTEGGLMYDEPLDQSAITFRLHDNLINQAPSMALTYTVDIVPPLEKTIDDVGVANDITVTNADGSVYHLEEAAGRMSTLPPPAGVGRYKLPLDVNMAGADQLPDRANWELTAGTLERPRYQAVMINLAKLPALRPTVTALRPGHIVSLTGVEPETVLLRVMNIERAGDAVNDIATLNCLPAEIWAPGKYDDGIARYDSGTTILKTGVSSSATSLVFRTTDPGEVWSTTAVPYDVVIAGQRNRVTAMGAAALVSGAYDQTATVTRAVNGVTKALSANAEIHVFNVGRYAPGGP